MKVLRNTYNTLITTEKGRSQAGSKEVLIRVAGMVEDSGRIVRRLGRTGFEVNVLGLGGHTYPVGNGPDHFMTAEDRAKLVHYLVSSGANYFDTTWIEEVELLADSLSRANVKEKVLVSLHGGCLTEPQWSRELRQGIEARLDILGFTDASLFIVNVGDREASYAEVISACETLQKLKEEHIVQNIGLSCHTISLFPVISRVIRETDMIDYIMVRFNWKFQQANEELFPVAEDHDVGIVGMKLFCWDCSPGFWDRRISVFEPVNREHRTENEPSLTPAQRHLLWCIQNSPCDVFVPAMNSMWEVEQNIQALRSMGIKVGTDDFERYRVRLWNEKEIKKLALHAESKTIRERAEILLTPRKSLRKLGHLMIRTIRAHFKILKNEGLKKYLLRSYHYRKAQVSNWVKRVRT